MIYGRRIERGTTMKSFLLKLNLQLFAEESGAESVPDAEVQQENESTSSETGVESQAAAEPEKNFEKAFAKRLAAKEAEIEARFAEKYKGHDDYKMLAEYLQEVNPGADILTLKEQIELERLQSRAERENVPPEVLKRIDSLEAKAAKADEYEQQQQQQRVYQEFRTNLETFAKERGMDPEELHTFMYEKQVTDFELAFDAMEARKLREQINGAKKDGVKEFLSAKSSIPSVTGNKAQGYIASPPVKTMEEARQRALQRLQ